MKRAYRLLSLTALLAMMLSARGADAVTYLHNSIMFNWGNTAPNVAGGCVTHSVFDLKKLPRFSFLKIIRLPLVPMLLTFDYVVQFVGLGLLVRKIYAR